MKYVILFFLSIFCSPNTFSKPTFKIGAIYPKQGPMQNSHCISKALIDNSHLKNIKIEFVALDSGGTISGSINAAKKAQRSGLDLVVGGRSSQEAIAISKTLAGSNVVYIATTASHPDVTLINNNTLRLMSDSYRYSKLISSFMVRQLPPKGKILVISNLSLPYSTFYANQTRKNIIELNGDIKFSFYNLIERQGSNGGLLKKVNQIEPDLIYAPLYFEQTAQLLREIESYKKNVTIIGHGGLASRRKYFNQFTKAHKNFTIYFNDMWDGEPKPPFKKEFLSLIGLYCDKMSDISRTAAAYDVLKLTLQTLSKNGLLIGPSLVSKIKSSDFNGVTGKLVYSGQGEPIRPFALYKVQSGNGALYGLLND